MSKRVLCLVADGVEELELIAPVDVLRRAGAEVVMADDEYPVSVAKLPADVTTSVQEYFPGSEIVSAMVDEDDD
ncbi:MAG: DJ-1/PfpI family protein, partial [Chthoniobacterales bacterium]